MIRYLTVCLIVLAARPGLAADETIYESFDDIAIGRVFLSQAERDRLDLRRTQPAASASSETASTETETDESVQTRPAGYIIGRNGRAKVWKAGEFIGAADATQRAFPGDVVIRKHKTSQAESGDADAN